MSTVAERVAAGAAYLDARDPGWWTRLDLASLDIWSCSKCVLGQLYGYGHGELDFDPDLGFDIAAGPYTSAAAAPLTAEWRRLIAARLAVTR